jgi:hypothetical protein
MLKMKKFLLFVMCFAASACFASAPSRCAQSAPTTAPEFCSSFKSVASCHCTESGLPSFACDSMSFLYNAMVARFGTVERACASQHDTSTQNCIDDWNCYRLGGYNSQGGACGGTGGSC